MKTIKSMLDDYNAKMDLWNDIILDPEALKDRNKTKDEALILFNYYEGKRDALLEVLHIDTKSLDTKRLDWIASNNANIRATNGFSITWPGAHSAYSTNQCKTVREALDKSMSGIYSKHKFNNVD